MGTEAGGLLAVRGTWGSPGRGSAPSPPGRGSPCQLRRASERSDSPEGARGDCGRNRRGPDTSSESRAVKNVAEGTSGHEHQERLAGPGAAMAARRSCAPLRRSPPASAVSAYLPRSPPAAVQSRPPLKPRPTKEGRTNPVRPSAFTRPKEAGSCSFSRPSEAAQAPSSEVVLFKPRLQFTSTLSLIIF